MNWYKKAQEEPKKDSERKYYSSVGKDFIQELKNQISSIVGGNSTSLFERACVQIPSDIKWQEEEYKLKNHYGEMARLKVEISGSKNQLDIYLATVYVKVNGNGEFIFSGDVYEKEYDPEYHKLLNEDQNKRPSHDITNIIMRSQADKNPIGFFGDTVIPEDFKIKLEYAKTPKESAQKIREIIWSGNNDNPDIIETTLPPINNPSPEIPQLQYAEKIMNWYKKAQEEPKLNKSNIPLPTVPQLIAILRSHHLVGNIGKVKNAYVVGSFAKGTQEDRSDIDILLEIEPIKNTSSEEFAENKRNKIRKYFMENNIRGVQDSIHPNWYGRRLDLYFTYDASTETRPKIKLPWSRNELV